MTWQISATPESWPLARPFAISRGVKTVAEVIVAEVTEDRVAGRGECVPYARYGETIDGVLNIIRDYDPSMGRAELACNLPPGAARNALDCAFWDLEAKREGKRVWELTGTPLPEPMVTAETISLGTIEEMAAAASRLSRNPLIKVKLDAKNVAKRMRVVRKNAPDARLIIDPNESWDLDLLCDVVQVLAELDVEMIEQPLPAAADDGLEEFTWPMPLCADESCHTTDDLERLRGKYQMVNIKLDKSGGLSEALALTRAATEAGFGIMVGCMVATSLAMAPALVLAPFARFLDLDGPLLLERDRELGLTFTDGKIYPPGPGLWG